MLVDLLLLAAGTGGLIWVATRWDEFDGPERSGNLLLLLGLALTGAVGLAGAAGPVRLAGQALAGVLAAAGFYLLVVRGDGVPRPAAKSDPADVPEELEGDRER